MTIPEVRVELSKLMVTLVEVAQTLTDITQEIAYLRGELHRRPAVRKARAKSKPLDKAMAKQIRFTAKYHPDWSYEEIGRYTGVNIGRVSEALRGKRK